jgi:hypothetical protein
METQKMINALQTKYREKFHYIWECTFNLQPITPSENELCNIINDREMFRGGRTEVFSAYARQTKDISIQHHDVTSMYPFICAFKMLPFGHPTIYFGSTIDRNKIRRGGYFGYIRCRITPNPDCVLGLLLNISNGKLQFDLFPKVGVWFTEEIYIAVDRGYIVNEVYEVFDFQGDNKRDDYFRGYMSYFLRLKQEAEGWKKAGASSESPSEIEQDEVCESLYLQNGNIAKMTKSQVKKNPVKRALAKLNLNCLWGKLAQDAHNDQKKLIFNYDMWMKQIKMNPEIDKKSIRYRKVNTGASYMCYYSLFREYGRQNRRVNIWLASAVTAWARTILHERMFLVGPEKVLYCDTDSVVFLKLRTDTTQYTSRGLGNWTDETEEGVQIEQFLGLAPKCYMKIESDHAAGIMKAKGVRLTVTNRAKTTPAMICSLLEQEIMYPQEEKEPPLLMNCMTITPNCLDSNYDYASLFTIYGKKIFRAVLNKREIVPFPQSERKFSLFAGDIERLYLKPYSPDVSDYYNHVYDSYR